MTAPTLFPETAAILAEGLQGIGYIGSLLERDYAFPDWFIGQELRTLDVAAFGQTPVSYESACIGVACANGVREQALVNAFRAFGAPVLLEVDRDEVREWEVSKEPDRHNLVGRYPASQIRAMLAQRAQDWQPKNILRAKNIGLDADTTIQRSLFTGLIPELEAEIQDKLDPLLRSALASTKRAYKRSTGHTADDRSLFRLVFLALTAKVFADRRVTKFVGTGEPDVILEVAAKYDGQSARLLNRYARSAAVEAVWSGLDFRNLSVEVLADIWSRTLVDSETKKELGIHRTPRSIVRYLVKHVMQSATSGDDDRIIFEPCSGSATFLIGALNYLRNSLPFASGETRHKHFVRTLYGVEKDTFAVELSGLALTLADFPNKNDWNITEADVFDDGTISSYLKKASVVLCNPPFGKFTSQERAKYGPVHPRKPGELIKRVLADLHPRGVLGFVLPHIFVDGREYRDTRRLLGERFGAIEITVLPEKSFAGAPTDIALLVARDPILHDSVRVTFGKVADSKASWQSFQDCEKVSARREETLSVAELTQSVSLPELQELWDRLDGSNTLDDVADTHRGIEWLADVGHSDHLSSTDAPGYVRGIAPRTEFHSFEVPRTQYLDVRPDGQRFLAYKRPWHRPKVILRKTRASRGNWRLVTFPDQEGLCCYQTYFGVWPHSQAPFNEIVLSAILNGPVANAFVATHEGARDITAAVLDLIPMPSLSGDQMNQIRDLVKRYQTSIATIQLDQPEDPEGLLRHIDAVILDGYRLPPRLEKEVLDFFNGSTRKAGHPFSNYFPDDLDVYVSLSQYLSRNVQSATVVNMLTRTAQR